MSKQIKLDARKRVTLGEMASHDYYLGSVDDQGVITLTPAVVVPVVTNGVERPEIMSKFVIDKLAQGFDRDRSVIVERRPRQRLNDR